MTLKLLLVTYLIGGLTFLPLTALTVLAILWFTSPIVDDKPSVVDQAEKKKQEPPAQGAASSTFAVLRRYDFQSATAALKAASSNSNDTENGTDGQSTESVSLYQSMYRSVFDRGRNAVNPMQETVEQAHKTKAKAAGKVFYIVLRHGHLILYDSAVQFEVRHVISLAHLAISLQDDITFNAPDFEESNIFARRTAIVLTPHDASSEKKPYFLFGDVNFEKEDFYYALLSSTANPPIPRPLEVDSMIKLQSTLHSNSLTPETRAFNALLGRVFLALHRTPFAEAFVKRKIETKMARIPKPAFIASIACHSLNLGDAAPIISNLKLKDINIDGETVLTCDFKYQGGVNLTIAAAAKLDLGARFKTRMVSLLLAVVMQRIQGKMQIKIKPPPSNRLWFCFETMPDMDLKVEPVVSSRQITWTFLLRAIEAKIREAFAEGMVKPNWDDVPFFATEQQEYRGGIWDIGSPEEVQQETEAGETVAEVHPLSERNDKTASMPALSTGAEADDSDGIKRRSTANLISQAAKTAAEKASAQLPGHRPALSPSQSSRPPKSIRSPSITSEATTASVDVSADAVRADSATPPKRRWIGRNAQATAQKLDVADIVRQVRDRDAQVRRDDSSDEIPTIGSEDQLTQGESNRRGSARSADYEPSSFNHTRSPTQSSLNSQSSLESKHVRGASTDSTLNLQRKPVLAATAAATIAARQWAWNAVQNRKQGQPIFSRNAQKQDSQTADGSAEGRAKDPSDRKPGLPAGPIGRGQPLPPPGKPLPGPPQKGIWSAAAAGIGSMRRKPTPTLPSRRANMEQTLSSAPDPGHDTTSSDALSLQDDSSPPTELIDLAADNMSHSSVHPEGDTDFGPWMINDQQEVSPGFEDDTTTEDVTQDEIKLPVYNAAQVEPEHIEALPSPVKKKPPPLPRRPVASSVDAELDAAPQADEMAQGSTTPVTDDAAMIADSFAQSELGSSFGYEDRRITSNDAEADHSAAARHGHQAAGDAMEPWKQEAPPSVDDIVPPLPAPAVSKNSRVAMQDTTDDSFDHTGTGTASRHVLQAADSAMAATAGTHAEDMRR